MPHMCVTSVFELLVCLFVLTAVAVVVLTPRQGSNHKNPIFPMMCHMCTHFSCCTENAFSLQAIRMGAG